MEQDTSRFRAALAAAAGPDGVAAVLRLLGFEAPLTPLAGAARAALGLGDEPGLRTVHWAGERAGLVALFLHVESTSPELVARLARRVRASRAARPTLLLFSAPGFDTLVFACFGLDGGLRRLAIEPSQPRAAELETLEEMAARNGEGGIALAMRQARALDRARIGRRFFRELRAHREAIALAWMGIPRLDRAEREQLALLLLSRLMFLYFLQRRGQLDGDPRFVPMLLARWQQQRSQLEQPRQPEQPRPLEQCSPRTFYQGMLAPLFFGALNTRPEAREPRALALGALPYLNGGLFERHVLELRYPTLDLPDDATRALILDLLERYRFTTRDAAEEDVYDGGIDPEMLGRVFEELMATERRGATGTFYTPARVVERVVRLALEAHICRRFAVPARAAAALVRLGHVRGVGSGSRQQIAAELAALTVLDPACGSGAFLLGALAALTRVRTALTAGDAAAVRREIVGHTLHGVDLQDDAALLCALRLWLALAVPGRDPATPAVQPLPNLDRRIRQGDALVDPLDLIAAAAGPAVWASASRDAVVRRAIRALQPLADRYLSAGPEDKPALQPALSAAERELARAWLDALERRLRHHTREMRTQAEARDLFGELSEQAQRAARSVALLEARHAELGSLRAGLELAGALPFFSPRVHFAGAATRGFDLVLSNPPWVRAHRWPAALNALVRQRYEVCRSAGWQQGAALAGALAAAGAQVDLALLFLERSLGLLAPAGTLGLLLPAKLLRSLFGSTGRRLLLQQTILDRMEDHSLDQRSLFRADSFAMVLIAHKATNGATASRANGVAATPGRENGVAQADEPVVAGENAVRITMIRRGVPALRFATPQRELPVFAGDAESPWLLAPPQARHALRRMQAAGAALALHGLRVRRGVLTGANDVLLARDADPKLGGLAWIHAEGWHRARASGGANGAAQRFAALIEAAALRPLLRGRGIAPWRYRTDGCVIWTHDDATGRALAPPPRLAKYLARHATRLRSRSGWRPGMPDGALFRVYADTTAPKVAWHDLAENLNAVALPARVRALGHALPIVPLNTVYFIPVTSERQALLLAALLNSLPVRTFARAIAERAKDAHFRFFAWTVGVLPLPGGWEDGPAAERLVELSRLAHERGGLAADGCTELDELAARMYALPCADLDALREFDQWLRGEA